PARGRLRLRAGRIFPLDTANKVRHRLVHRKQPRIRARQKGRPMTTTQMTVNPEARAIIRSRIENAKVSLRDTRGSLFRTNHTKARWLAEGERCVGIVGAFTNMAIRSPAGARAVTDEPRILSYGSNGVLEHEEAASGPASECFEAQFGR